MLYCPIGTFDASTPNTGLYKTVVLRDNMLFALGTDGTVTVPFDDIALPSAFYIQMSAGYEQACAVRQDQALGCSPGVLPPSLATGQYTQVALTYYGSVCAIRVDQTLACSADLAPPAGQFTRIVGSTSAMCGIRTDGSIACWGSTAPVPAAGW